MFPFSLAWHFACLFLARTSAEQPERLPAALGHARAEAPIGGGSGNGLRSGFHRASRAGSESTSGL